MSPGSETLDEIEEAVLHLPVGERSPLAARLIDSREDDAPSVGEAWRSELSSRADQIDRGAIEPVPAEEVWRRVNERFATGF